MDEGAVIFLVAVIIVMTAYAGYQQWLRQQRRFMVHRERLAALEKGVELPPLEREVQRLGWNVQRLLLFGGLIWLSLGLSAYLVLSALVGETFHVNWGLDRIGNRVWVPVQVRPGMEWVGAALFGIGVSHLIVYFVGRNKER
jgi:hypothetical protein